MLTVPIGCQTVFSSRKAAISHGLCAVAAPLTTRLTLSAAARSSSGARPSAPVTSIAFTSMCAASHGASSARWPVRMLTTPPGTSEVASASANSIAASGCCSEATTTAALPPTIAGASLRDEPLERGLVGREDPDDAGRLRDREVEVRPGDRVRPAEHLRELVRPARVPDHAIDRGVDLLRARAVRGEVGAAGLHRLGDPVEHLAAVVGGRPGPAGLRRAGRANGVAEVLARGAGDVLALGEVGAPGLGARERAADVELVRLLDGEPAHSNSRYGSSPWRPPSRPKPDSL